MGHRHCFVSAEIIQVEVLRKLIFKRQHFFLCFNDSSRGNTAYLLQTNAGKIPVYCHMTSHGIGGCGGGGWTLVMKIDGYKVRHNNAI